MAKTIAIVAALDTKGAEAQLIRDIIAQRGHTPLLIDTGVLGDPRITPDVSSREVARAGGADLDELRQSRDKGRAMAAMTNGAARIAIELNKSGRVDGMIGLGGTAGTVIGSSALRSLPIGIPKMLVSTVASGDTRPYIGTKDIAMLYSVVDIAGVNRISATVLSNAAGAICGMVETKVPAVEERPLIAASMFGNTTQCVDRARGNLEAAGYEVLVFHATGTGGETMEHLIADGYFVGSLDLTTTELADDLCGGVFSAGPHRLEAAGSVGIPQVVAPGCLDMVNFGAPSTVPDQFKKRHLYEWNPNVTLMRTTPEENAELGRRLATKVNQSKGPAVILLPLRGVSQLDSPGGDFWSEEADHALFAAIKAAGGPNVKIIELDLNINDKAFADRASEELKSLVRAHSETATIQVT